MINNSEETILSKGRYISIIVGTIIGVGILAMPKGITKIAHQDGWISTMLGVIYPLYTIIISSYVIKRYPNDDILTISKKKLGNILGRILNFIFMTFWIFVGTNVICGYSNLMRSYVVGWLTPFKIICICTLVISYSAYKGLETVAKIAEVALYLTIIFALSAIPALKLSSPLNIKPIFGSGTYSILNGVIPSLLSYSGVEVMYLYHPYVKEKSKVKWYSLISIAFVMVIYAWICFISIFYLGPDIVIKSQWPFLLATQSVTITLINNYSYFFIFMWSIIIIKCAVICYYSAMKVLKDFIPKGSNKSISAALYPLFVLVALKMGNELNRRAIVDELIRYFTIFNVSYITLIAIVIFFSKER